MTIKANTQNNDRVATTNELHKQACKCFRGLKRSLIACKTCRDWRRVYTRVGGDYVAN
jgi:hypothetical protein